VANWKRLVSPAAVCLSGTLLAKWRQPVPVPDLKTLVSHLQTPLREEEKVPVTQEEFNHLVRPYSLASPYSELRAEQVATLFRVSDEEKAHDIHNVLEYALMRSSRMTGSKAAFHSTWDVNIAEIFRIILRDGEDFRGSNLESDADLEIPDYGFLVKNSCLFRGEEAAPGSEEEPGFELLNKLFYTYEPLEYILGLS
jgi:hypothetical protein